MVTIQWIQLTEEALTKKLDIVKIFQDKSEDALVIRPEIIIKKAEANRGMLMRESFHRFIPFPIKWFPYTRKLFYRNKESYPGADNSMLFNRNVIDDNILFRHRNKRTWGAPSGRGSGRDFAFRVAMKYKNNWSFRLPMYLWDVKMQNQEYVDDLKYLIS
jgi:hypothetical protein